MIAIIRTLLYGTPCHDLTQYLASSGETDRNAERATLYGWRVGRWIHEHKKPREAVNFLADRLRAGERVIAKRAALWERPGIVVTRFPRKAAGSVVVSLRRRANRGAA